MIPLHLADIKYKSYIFFQNYNALRNLLNYLKLQKKQGKNILYKINKKKTINNFMQKERLHKTRILTLQNELG